MGELVIRAIGVRHLFGYPYTEHIWEGLHDFIYAFPVDQIEVYLLSTLYFVGKIAFSLPWPPSVE